MAQIQVSQYTSPLKVRSQRSSMTSAMFTVVSVGTVFDVSRKADVYGPGKSYNIFAGKDGSRGLGMSSLKTEDAVPDYTTLDEKDMGTLNEWHVFFTCVSHSARALLGRYGFTDAPIGSDTISLGRWLTCHRKFISMVSMGTVQTYSSRALSMP